MQKVVRKLTQVIRVVKAGIARLRSSIGLGLLLLSCWYLSLEWPQALREVQVGKLTKIPMRCFVPRNGCCNGGIEVAQEDILAVNFDPSHPLTMALGTFRDSYIPGSIVPTFSTILHALSRRTFAKVNSSVIQSVVVVMVYIFTLGSPYDDSMHEPQLSIASVITAALPFPNCMPLSLGQPRIIGSIDNRDLSLCKRYLSGGHTI